MLLFHRWLFLRIRMCCPLTPLSQTSVGWPGHIVCTIALVAFWYSSAAHTRGAGLHSERFSETWLQVLQSLRTSVSSSGNPLSEAEMDRHTLKGLREGIYARELTLLGNQPVCCIAGAVLRDKQAASAARVCRHRDVGSVKMGRHVLKGLREGINASRPARTRTRRLASALFGRCGAIRQVHCMSVLAVMAAA